MKRRAKPGDVGSRLLDPYPKYLQIRDILLRRIEREKHAGDRLATEAELGAEFGVSRETIRDALIGLEKEGLIRRAPGSGTFVARLPRRDRERRLTGLSEGYTRFNLDTQARVLFIGEIPAGHDIAAVLECESRVVTRISRLRSLEGEPFAVHEAYLPLDIGSGVAERDLTQTSIVHVLRRGLKLAIWEDRQRIEALAADTEIARLLGIGIGCPVLHIERLFRDADDRPVVLFRSHYRSDRYYYTVTLGKPDAKSPTQGVAGRQSSRDEVTSRAALRSRPTSASSPVLRRPTRRGQIAKG